MKINRYQIFALLMLTGAFCACTHDDGIENVKEGSPATLTLTFDAGTFPVETVTRAAIAAVDENKVHNLYLFIFNQNGSINTRKFFTYDQLQNKVEGAASTSGKVSLNTTSGSKSIYVVANIDDKSPVADLSKSTLDAITDKKALDSLVVSAKPGMTTVSRIDGKLLMSGSVQPTLVAGANNVTVPLKRVCAKVKFTINTGSGITFTSKSWHVMRVPAKVRLMENTASVDGGVKDNADFFESVEGVFENEGTSFVFYQYENRKTPKTSIPGSGTTAYALREKQQKNPTGEGGVSNGGYVYADDNASAVVIKGKYEKTETDGRKTIAYVTYTVHLGYIGNNANDFNTLRNTFYQYTLTVNGVENIIVEAMATDAGTEPSPGMNGSVLRSSILKFFDAHYAACIVKIPRSAALNPSPTPFYVNTPFDKQGTTDINWVKFSKNGTSEPNRIAAYPGENSPALKNVQQIFDEIKTAHQNNTPYYFVTEGGTEYAHFTAFVSEYYYERDPMTANAPVDPTLWKRFVDQPDRELVLAGGWSKSPDGMSDFSNNAIIIRQKSITTTYDVVNSRTGAGFEVLDESFGEEYLDNIGYNYGNNSRTNGWANSVLDWYLIPWSGVSPPADVVNNPASDSYWTGTQGNRQWTNFVDSRSIVQENKFGWGTNTLTGTQTYHYGGNNKARIACMARNRDINGNGYIDKNEVRWYLPAIEQMVNMWIGGGNRQSDEVMYHGSAYHAEMEYTRTGTVLSSPGKHALYLTSTASTTSNTEGRSNPFVFWSEEGSSISDLKNGITWSGINRKLFYTRCVRNLGSTDPSVQPHPFATVNTASRVISLVDPSSVSRITPDSYRNTQTEYLTGEYSPHNERDKANLPASKFQYAQNELYGGTNYTWNYLRDTPPGAQKCADYTEDPGGTDRGTWRIPNQRELMLMWRFQVLGSNLVWCASESKYDPSRAYMANNVIITMQPKNANGRVRCVRDLK